MAAHKVLPHGRLEQPADGVWRVKGSLPYPLHRNMIVVRLASGELLLHSVVALDEAGFRELEALGRPTIAIVPNVLHLMDAGAYKARYPRIRLIGPAETKAAIADKIAIDAAVEEVLPPLGFVLHAVPGAKAAEYVYEYPLPLGGRMLIVNDVFGSANAHDESRLLGRLMIRHMCVPGNRLGVARIYRWRMVTDLDAIKRFAAELAAIPDLRLITVSHGDPVVTAPAEVLRAVAA